MKTRVAWIDPSGKAHALLVDDMQDAAKQISELRKSLGFPEPTKDTVLAAVSLSSAGDKLAAKGTIDVNDLSDELKKDFNEKLADTLTNVSKKGLD